MDKTADTFKCKTYLPCKQNRNNPIYGSCLFPCLHRLVLHSHVLDYTNCLLLSRIHPICHSFPDWGNSLHSLPAFTDINLYKPDLRYSFINISFQSLRHPTTRTQTMVFPNSECLFSTSEFLNPQNFKVKPFWWFAWTVQINLLYPLHWMGSVLYSQLFPPIQFCLNFLKNDMLSDKIKIWLFSYKLVPSAWIYLKRFDTPFSMYPGKSLIFHLTKS